MKEIYQYIILLLLVLIMPFSMFSQNVTGLIDRDKILIGEQIQLKLKVENARTGINAWFSFPDSINHFEVVERQKIDTISVGDIINYQQTIVLTSFDSGQWKLPELTLVTGDHKVFKIAIPTLIDVLPVDVSNLQDYHDIKDIVEVNQTTSKIIIAIIATIALISLLIIYTLYKKKKTIAAPARTIPSSLTPLQWALQELQTLSTQPAATNVQVKQYYQKLTDIARNYFYLQLQHKSLYTTTDEWMVQFQALPLSTESKTSFFQVLRLSDAVKFAKYIPPSFENEQSISTTRQMIQQVASMFQHQSPTKEKAL